MKERFRLLVLLIYIAFSLTLPTSAGISEGGVWTTYTSEDSLPYDDVFDVGCEAASS